MPMRLIVLDTNILIKYPRIISLSIKNTRFIIPFVVLEELGLKRNGSIDVFSTLIEEARKKGILEIHDSPLFFIAKDQSLGDPMLSLADKALIEVSNRLSQQGNEVQIATEDKALAKVAYDKGIRILTGSDVKVLLKEETPENTIGDDVKKYLEDFI